MCKGMLKININTYKKMTDYFKSNQSVNLVLKIIYKYLPYIVFASYPILLAYVWFCINDLFLKILLVPAGVLMLVSLLRIIINEKRPYEKFSIESVFAKSTSGKSMPSRHTASAFIIAMAFMRVSILLSSAFIIISIIIAASRVLAGVHYIKDVIVGALISIIAGVVFLFLI